MVSGVKDFSSLGLSQLCDMTQSTEDESGQGQLALSLIKIDQLAERFESLRDLNFA
jgi:hypothetical protein